MRTTLPARLAALALVACTSAPGAGPPEPSPDAAPDGPADYFRGCTCVPPSPGFEFGCVALCATPSGEHTVTCNQRANTCFSQRFGVRGASATPSATAQGCDICRIAVNEGGLGRAIFAGPDAAAPDAPNADAAVDELLLDGPPTFDIPRADAADVGAPHVNPGALYAPCRADADCAGGAGCLTEVAAGLPGGQCNRACARNDDCVSAGPDGPVDGWCGAGPSGGADRCWQTCEFASECGREGYTCARVSAGFRACIPVCTDASCGAGTTCDHDTGRCRAPGAAPSGNAVGEPCPGVGPAADARCRSGLCRPEYTVGVGGARTYTGYNGGTCAARCSLPAGVSAALLTPVGVPSRLLQANCPAGSLCFPSSSYQQGELGTCFKACAGDADCRVGEGYQCLTTLRLSATETRPLATPFCAPVPCSADTDCPLSYSCRSNGTTRVCALIP